MLKKTLSALLVMFTLLLPSLGYAVPTIAWMSDTQQYASASSPMWAEMNNWILDNREKLDIRYVFHTGDIVSASKSDKQWRFAGNTMSILSEGDMPFLAVTGNHDTGYCESYSRYMDCVGSLQPMHFAQEYAETGSRYELLTIDGRDYIFLAIAYSTRGPSEEECLWARDVLAKYSDRIAIILTHSYIKRGTDYTTQGNVIYREIVKHSPNVLLVLCGHCRELSRRVDEIDCDDDGTPDNTVYTILTNFQAAKNGGDGYMRFLMFRQNEICIYTYSPILDTYEYGREQTIDLIPLPPLEQK
ncbi:MAG: metallophosphoesterase [Clostridia bacterium]|nr:metallophosphoesterase [Clostridia bacterium]